MEEAANYFAASVAQYSVNRLAFACFFYAKVCAQRRALRHIRYDVSVFCVCEGTSDGADRVHIR